MAERKSLVEGLNASTSAERAVEKAFVFGEKTTTAQTTASETKEGKGPPANTTSRSPVTTRMRSDFALALKRASLERQLEGIVPNTLQDILEEAVEPWLRAKGYLS